MVKVMRKRIGVASLLILLLCSIAVPLVGNADSKKAIIKEMVQSPADYSVSLMPGDYQLWVFRYYFNFEDYPRQAWFDGRLYRLTSSLPTVPCDVQFPGNNECWTCMELDLIRGDEFVKPCGDVLCNIEVIGPGSWKEFYCIDRLPQ